MPWDLDLHVLLVKGYTYKDHGIAYLLDENSVPLHTSITFELVRTVMLFALLHF